ncbi:MAG TPA: AAA family ATPase [Actinomycetota bacterium]|nr:AAA family ATPase [Actinomycetota bacterium]
MTPAGGSRPLLEREAEVAALDDAIHSALAGNGSVVIVEGTAGIGKTLLLEEASRRATRKGIRAVTARAAVLERDSGFGVVRQLFEPVAHRADPEARRRLLEGAAAIAAPLVAPDAAKPAAAPANPAAVLHGLYWLTANLTDPSPVLITVDDLHWCDSPSLHFLAYLSRRLEGMKVLVVCALRTGDPQVDAAAIAEMVTTPETRVLRPGPLSAHGVGQIVRSELSAGADESFIKACLDATGGVPFLINELISALRSEDVEPTDEAASKVARIGTRSIAHATMQRLSSLPPSAGAVARAVAILDRHARLDRVATLADVDPEETRAGVDALIQMEILTSGMPVRFAHPLVQQAIYDETPSAARGDAHGRAAEILAAEKAPPDEIATHLLLTEPTGHDDVVGILRAAAGQALGRGAPQSAVVYLRRAMAEGASGQDRVALLHDLGRAEALAGDARAIADLEEASRDTDDPVLRAQIASVLSQLYVMVGNWTGGHELLRRALAELGDRDPGLAAQIEAAWAGTGLYDPMHVPEVEPRLPALLERAHRSGTAARNLAVTLAGVGAQRGMDREEVLALVEQGLDGGRFLRDEGPESLFIPQIFGALVGFDELELADDVAKEVIDLARRRGSVAGFMTASFARLWIDAQRGALKTAEGHLRSMVEVCLEHGITFGLPSAFYCGVDLLLERPELTDIAAMAESIELEPAVARTTAGAFIPAVRGRLRILRGERKAGVSDLRAAGEIFTALRFRNPIVHWWRSPLALALPEGSREEAQALVEEELGDARALALPRAEGVALRAAGLLEGGERGIGLLNESLRVLEKMDATLERARTLVELGAALRRANLGAASRDSLKAGLELAFECGAERLTERALEELRLSGARPRRPVVSGPDALTSGEARVARMAADGMSNKDIAQSLFVTAKTVENQLSGVSEARGRRPRQTSRGSRHYRAFRRAFLISEASLLAWFVW